MYNLISNIGDISTTRPFINMLVPLMIETYLRYGINIKGNIKPIKSLKAKL